MAHQASAWAENPSQVVVGTDYSRQGKLVDTWRTVLIQKRSAITNSLQSSDDFVDRLVMYGVMNAATGELCRVSLYDNSSSPTTGVQQTQTCAVVRDQPNRFDCPTDESRYSDVQMN